MREERGDKKDYPVKFVSKLYPSLSCRLDRLIRLTRGNKRYLASPSPSDLSLICNTKL